MKELTFREKRFVELYDGNGTKAARDAGYKGSDNVLGVSANRLLRNPKIKSAIESRQKKEISSLIATRQDRQKFWTKVMNSSSEEIQARLRASELLGKSEADFIEKVEMKVNGTISERLSNARKRVSDAKSTNSKASNSSDSWTMRHASWETDVNKTMQAGGTD